MRKEVGKTLGERNSEGASSCRAKCYLLSRGRLLIPGGRRLNSWMKSNAVRQRARLLIKGLLENRHGSHSALLLTLP